MNDIDTHSESHFFYFCEASKELQNMMALSFDLSPEGTKAFNKAQERFNLARSRAQKEFAAIVPLLPRQD